MMLIGRLLRAQRKGVALACAANSYIYNCREVINAENLTNFGIR